MPGMWLRDGPDEFATETISAKHTDLPISRTLRIRGTRQNVRTDHLRQNVGRRAVVIAPDRRLWRRPVTTSAHRTTAPALAGTDVGRRRRHAP
jgi:hypothetical protein